MSARYELFGTLTRPRWNKVTNSHGVGDERAERLIDAHRAEVLAEVYAAIEDPAQRRAVGGGLGWETARDVVHNLLRKTKAGAA